MKIIIGILAIAAVTGWYGTVASYSLGYDAGNGSVNRNAEDASFRKGMESGQQVGRKQAEQNCSTSLDQRAQEQMNSLRDDANKRIQNAYQQGLQQGAAAEAKAIFDQHLVIAKGVK